MPQTAYFIKLLYKHKIVDDWTKKKAKMRWTKNKTKLRIVITKQTNKKLIMDIKPNIGSKIGWIKQYKTHFSTKSWIETMKRKPMSITP